MRKWLLPAAGAVAIFVAAVGTFAIAGGFDGDDDDGQRQEQVADESAGDDARCAEDATDCEDPNTESDGGALGMCAPGVTDCVDTAVDPAGACLEGTEDCVDADIDPDASESICIEGAPDCSDMVDAEDPGECDAAGDPAACEGRATEMAFADLEKRIPGVEIRIASVEYVEWPNTALGNPQDGVVYAEVITPGFKIILDAGGQSYEYHTDMTGNFTAVN